MMDKYGPSPQWKHINENHITKDSSRNLTTFRSTDVNYKLAYWDPRVNGVRYLKTLIYYLAANLSAENWSRLRRIRHRGLGDPISVTYDGESVCLDYLLAVFELEFIEQTLPLHSLRVLEIGAGYGRTCHAIMSNHDIASYCIIDLENSLRLAKEYLSRVLDPGQFEKVTFIPVGEVDDLPETVQFDLCININSFAEMKAETARDYLSFINGRCFFFYVKNPVAKYLDKSLDGHSQGIEVVAMALSTGLLQDIIEIHDNRAVAEKRQAFIDAYRPGDEWECTDDAWASPWSFYWQALYRRR
jgi:putative sugar O-methyltransferase